MNPRLRIILFAVTAIAQLLVAGMGIARYEFALQQGTAYRFETAPVDPVDLFRGRYVQLSFAAERSTLPLPSDTTDGQAYAVLGTDDRGFAKIVDLRATPPSQGDYIRVTAYSDFGPNAEGSRLQFAFDRFYAEESKAPELERRYRDHAANSDAKPAYAVVRVLDGVAVLEDLHIDD